MKYSQLHTKTSKSSKDFASVNATLLIKAGFIDQTMAGVYSFLPLGLRVLNKIEKIVREEMDKIGTEVSLPALSPKDLWETTGRLETVDVLMKTVAANEPAHLKNDSEYILNSTQEELITPIAKKFNASYRDFPFAFYQIQTKFRNEPRAKSGLLRGREFRMKDLYSFHTSETDLKEYYESVKTAYWKVFERLGLQGETYLALASGGDFTKDYSHEFQTRCEAGEDTIFLDTLTGVAYNREVAPEEALAVEGNSEDQQGKYEVFRAAEVGNIFPLGTKFTKAFNYTYTDEQGTEQPIYMGCYGIGTSRVMGVLVEKFHDDRGIIWPEAVAPFQVHLISLPGVEERAREVYDHLQNAGIEVLWDDREEAAGVKFADADLIGVPVRLVVSQKTGDQIEWKKRTETSTDLISLDEVTSRLS